MNDLRAKMRARAGGSSVSSLMNQSKEQVQQLKLARLQQQQQQQQSHLPRGTADSRGPVGVEAVTPEKKQSKTINIASLTRADAEVDGLPTRAGAPKPDFAYGENDDDDDGSDIEKVHADSAGASARRFYVPSSTSTVQSNAPLQSDPVGTTGGLGLPQGFFDDPREDIEARGLTVKDEIKRKEKEQEDALKSFLGEVNAIAEFNKGDSPDEDESEAGAEIDEAALQLAYETKAAVLMAKVERELDQLKGTGIARVAELVAIEEVDALIHEAAGTKRSNDDSDIYNDVLNALRQKRIKATNSAGGIVRSTITQQSDSSSDESYVPLDFTDWQSRAL